MRRLLVETPIKLIGYRQDGILFPWLILQPSLKLVRDPLILHKFDERTIVATLMIHVKIRNGLHLRLNPVIHNQIGIQSTNQKLRFGIPIYYS